MVLNPGHSWITRNSIATISASPSTEHCQLTCDYTEDSKAASAVAQTCDPSVQEAKAESQCGFKASLGYTVRRDRERGGKEGKKGKWERKTQVEEGQRS